MRSAYYLSANSKSMGHDMRFKQTRDILRSAQVYHAEVACRYKGFSKQVSSERTKLFLDYIADHEQRLAEVLTMYEGDLPQKLSEVWLECDSEIVPDGLASLEGELSQLSLDDFLVRYLQFDDYLIDVYKELKDRATLDSVKEIFNGLIELENHSEMAAVRDTIRLRDY